VEHTNDKLYFCDKFMIITFYIYIGLVPSYIYLTDLLGIYSFNTLVLPIFILIIYYFLSILERRKINFHIDAGLLLLVLIILIQLIYLPVIASDFPNGLNIYMKTIMNTIFISLYMWKNGNLIEIQKKIFEIKKYKGLIVSIYLIYILVILYGFLSNLNNTIGFKYSIEIGEKSGLYLFLGDTFAIYSLIIISITKKNSYKIINFFIGILALYSISSRMSLIAYVVTVILYIAIQIVKSKYKKIAFGAFIFLIVLATLIYFNQDEIIKYLSESAPNSRVFSLLYLGKEDASVTGRSYLMQVGLAELKNNWFFGRFLYEVYFFGDTGYYIHNFLSIWAEYGLIPFLFFIIYISYNFIKVTHMQLLNKGRFDNIMFLLACFTILSILFGRSYNFSYIWFVIGAFPNSFSKKI